MKEKKKFKNEGKIGGKEEKFFKHEIKKIRKGEKIKMEKKILVIKIGKKL